MGQIFFRKTGNFWARNFGVLQILGLIAVLTVGCVGLRELGAGYE